LIRYYDEDTPSVAGLATGKKVNDIPAKSVNRDEFCMFADGSHATIAKEKKGG
jgi:hypothetical protein